MTQLVERLYPTPEICCSNPVISNFYLLSTVFKRQNKFAKIFNEFAKVGSKFCQTLNKPSHFCQRFLKVCPSGEILPNLVTLEAISTSVKRVMEKLCCCHADHLKQPTHIIFQHKKVLEMISQFMRKECKVKVCKKRANFYE